MACFRVPARRALAALSILCFIGVVGCDSETGSADAGPGARDAGSGGSDAGSGGDAGTMDAGPPGADAGAGDAGAPSTDAGIDAGGMDAGLGCAPGAITVMDTCPAFTPCGGSIVGSWCYSDICVERAEIIGDVMGCSADQIALTSFTGTVVGGVVADASVIDRAANTHLEGTVSVAGACYMSISAACTGIIQPAIDRALGDNGTARCAHDVTDDQCDCAVEIDAMVRERDTYTTMDNEIIVGTGPAQRTYDYCVELDGSIRFRESTGGATDEFGIQTIAPAP